MHEQLELFKAINAYPGPGTARSKMAVVLDTCCLPVCLVDTAVTREMRNLLHPASGLGTAFSITVVMRMQTEAKQHCQACARAVQRSCVFLQLCQQVCETLDGKDRHLANITRTPMADASQAASVLRATSLSPFKAIDNNMLMLFPLPLPVSPHTTHARTYARTCC